MQVVTFCQTAAEACVAFGAAAVAPRINAFAAAAGVPETNPKDLSGLQNLLQNFADPFVQCFFPEHAGLVLVFCTMMLVAGPPMYHTTLLMMLTAFFRSPNLKLGDFAGTPEHAAVLRTLTLLVEGSNSTQVLELMDIVLSHLAMGGAGSGGVGGGQNGEDVRAPLPMELIPVAGPEPHACVPIQCAPCMRHMRAHNASFPLSCYSVVPLPVLLVNCINDIMSHKKLQLPVLLTCAVVLRAALFTPCLERQAPFTQPLGAS